jgi:hypothetical protein
MRNSASEKKMPKGATTRLDAAFEDIMHSPLVQMSNRLAGGWLSSRLEKQKNQNVTEALEGANTASSNAKGKEVGIY